MESWKSFEDFEDDFVFDFEVPALSKEEIIGFASDYDPQRFHLDESEAAKTHFGGLVSSGFQTQLMCFQPFCRQVLNNSYAVGAPGIEELKWLRPWYPGEALEGRVKLTGKRYDKVSGSRAIAPHLHLDANRSHSFRVLVKGIRRIVDGS